LIKLDSRAENMCVYCDRNEQHAVPLDTTAVWLALSLLGDDKAELHDATCSCGPQEGQHRVCK
jgi:hypothetical protein